MILENKNKLSFVDTLGDFSVLGEIVFIPKLDTFYNLSSLKDAENKIAILSVVVFCNKPVLTHGDINGREYLFFYSVNGNFSSFRIVDDKMENLSFLSHDGFCLVILLEIELKTM